MGQCCKCGKETRNAYEYYACEKIVSDGIVSYGGLEKQSGFMCSRCVLVRSMLIASLFFLVYLGLAVYAWDEIWPWAFAAMYFGAVIYFWVRLLLDKRVPFKAGENEAVGQLIEIRSSQNPETVYFASLEEYEKLTGGIIP